MPAPDYSIARQYSGGSLLKRNIVEALAEFESARGSGDRYGPSALIGYTQAVAGRRAEATAVLHALMNTSKQSYVPPIQRTLHHGIGDDAETLDWLEQAYRRGTFEWCSLAWIPCGTAFARIAVSTHS